MPLLSRFRAVLSPAIERARRSLRLRARESWRMHAGCMLLGLLWLVACEPPPRFEPLTPELHATGIRVERLGAFPMTLEAVELSALGSPERVQQLSVRGWQTPLERLSASEPRLKLEGQGVQPRPSFAQAERESTGVTSTGVTSAGAVSAATTESASSERAGPPDLAAGPNPAGPNPAGLGAPVLFPFPTAAAWQALQRQPLELSAARLEGDLKTGALKLEGRVKAERGTFVLEAGAAQVTWSVEGKLERLEARGAVQFRWGEQRGQADRLSWLEKEALLTLEGQAILTAGAQEVKGRVLRWDLARATLTCEGCIVRLPGESP
ncbi:MAG: LptA/OstA family protein [Myxococcota bacterium]